MIRLGYAFKSSLLLVFALCCVPFCIDYYALPIVTFYVEWTSLFLGLLILLCFFFIPVEHVWIPRLSIWLGVFALYLLLQPLLAGIKYTEFGILLPLCILWAALLIWVSKSLLSHSSLISVVALGIALGALINTLYGLNQWLGGQNVNGILAQANNYADYACLGVISIIYLYEKEKAPPIVVALYLILSIVVFSFSYSRSLILYLSVAFFLSLFFRIPKHIKVTLGIMSLLLISTSFGAVHRMFIEANSVVLGNSLLPSGMYSSDNMRLFMWWAAWRNFLDHPFFGIGAGNYYFTYKNLYSVYAHNLPLQILAEAGLIGFCLFFYGLYRYMRSMKAVSIEAWYIYSFVAIIAIHSCLEFPLFYSQFLGITALMLGIYSNEFVNFRFRLWMRLLYGAVIIAAIGFMLHVYWDYGRFQEDVTITDMILKDNAVVPPEWSKLRIEMHNKDE